MFVSFYINFTLVPRHWLFTGSLWCLKQPLGHMFSENNTSQINTTLWRVVLSYLMIINLRSWFLSILADLQLFIDQIYMAGKTSIPAVC